MARWKWFAEPADTRLDQLPTWMTEPTAERPTVVGNRRTPLLTPLSEQRCATPPARPR